MTTTDPAERLIEDLRWSMPTTSETRDKIRAALAAAYQRGRDDGEKRAYLVAFEEGEIHERERIRAAVLSSKWADDAVIANADLFALLDAQADR